MNIDLSQREMELILTLINDAAKGDFSLSGPPIYSDEELALVERFESAMSKFDAQNGGVKK